MRDIKMRGYAVEEMIGSQWMYGTGIHVTEFTDEYAKETGIKEECFVWTDSGWVEVHKKSIGQYTGLNDKNGCEIFEKDVLNIEGPGYPFVPSWKGIVKFIDGSYLIENLEGTDGEYLFDELREVEIIGNIHDNPELLGDIQ